MMSMAGARFRLDTAAGIGMDTFPFVTVRIRDEGE
jgi:hypothetical protein